MSAARIRPSRLLLALTAAWLALGVAVPFWPPAWTPWWVSGAVLCGAAGFQALRLRATPLPDVERTVAGSLPVDVWRPVALRITLPWHHGPLRLRVFDHHPTEVEADGMPFVHDLPAGADDGIEVSYRVRASQRGDLAFGPTQLRLERRLGLWVQGGFRGAGERVRVYPNFAAVTRYALLAVDDRIQQMGIRRRRRRGTGLDFHQLREYRDGDVLRQIDWKATSRRRQLISREYQEERDQQVVFLLDCGRRMHARDGELSHFDQALNAVLLLTYVALRQGDAVGLATFSGTERFLPPVKGATGLTTMLNQVYDLQTTMQPSDFLEAATRAMRHVPRRALLVWITNLRDEDADDLLPALQMLRHRHLVLIASLRENVVEEVLDEPVHGFKDALRHCAAHQYLHERRRVHQDLSGRGVMVLDTSPAGLPTGIVNRYLDVKRAGML